MDPDNIRNELLGGRADITALAASLSCTSRTIYAMAARLRLPYVKIAGRRFYEIAALRGALENASGNLPPSRRGRPRKTAAA